MPVITPPKLDKSRQHHGPFAGEQWGSFRIIAELQPVIRHTGPGDLGRERIFSVRCLCGASHTVKRRDLMNVEGRQNLSCGACRGMTVNRANRRWPDGVYGAWKILGRCIRDGQRMWRLECRTCLKIKYEDALRERRISQPCQHCARLEYLEQRLRAQARARGSVIVRLELK